MVAFPDDEEIGKPIEGTTGENLLRDQDALDNAATRLRIAKLAEVPGQLPAERLVRRAGCDHAARIAPDHIKAQRAADLVMRQSAAKREGFAPSAQSAARHDGSRARCRGPGKQAKACAMAAVDRLCERRHQVIAGDIPCHAKRREQQDRGFKAGFFHDLADRPIERLIDGLDRLMKACIGFRPVVGMSGIEQMPEQMADAVRPP